MAKNMQNEAERPEEQLQDDSPIDNVNQDRFRRTQFVQNLAKALITETKQKTKSKVIALTGKWGVGKSSVINMVKDEIKKAENKNLYVLNFNPWQYTDNEDLIKPFLEELFIGTKLFGLKWKIAKYQKTFSFSQSKEYFLELVIAANAFITFIIAVRNDIFKIPIRDDTTGQFLYIIQWVLYFIPVFLFVFLFFFSILKVIYKFLNNRFKSEKIDLQTQKEDISKYLKDKKIHFIVIVDDIDRLTPKEALQLFRIIRTNADFENTTYLLSFDKEVVVRNLNCENILGEDFIEKIITTEYAISEPPKFYMRKYLTDEVMALIKISSKWQDDIKTDNYKFSQIIYLLTTVLVNMRDIKRYSNSLKMHSRNLINDGIAEVNFIDLMIIECLMLKFRDCYYGIYNNKSYLLTTKEYSAGNKLIYEPDTKEFIRKQNEYNTEVKENIKRFCKTETELKMLLWLFPGLLFAFKDEINISILNYRPNQVLRNNICVANSFDAYFSSGINIDDPEHITNKELSEFTATTADKNSMLTYLKNCKEKGKLELLIEILRDVCKTDSFIPVKNASDFVAAMFDVQSLTPRKQRVYFATDTRSNCKEIICSYLKKNLQTSKEIVLDAVKKTDSLYPLLSFLFDQKHKLDVVNPDAVLNKNEIQDVKKSIFDKLENYYRNNRNKFFKDDDLEEVLGFWYNIDNIHFEKTLKTEKSSVKKLCELMINLYKQRNLREEYYFPYATMGYFADLDVIKQRLENALKKGSLDKRNKAISKCFLDNFKYRDFQIGMTISDEVRAFDSECDAGEMENA